MGERHVHIDTLGHQGDGIVETEKGPLYVAFALPGEEVIIEEGPEAGRAILRRIVTPSASRVAAPCAHFGKCGGCALQHLEAASYAEWKRNQVVTALAGQGLTGIAVAPLVPTQPGTRRRATFAVTRTRKGATLGFYEKSSHTIVPLAMCPILVPEIEAALPLLAALVAPGLSRKARAAVSVTQMANGIDVHVMGGKPDLPLAEREEIAQGARQAGLARLTWDDEILFMTEPPLVNLAGFDVSPPPGAFLQASAAAEKTLTDLVVDGVGGARRIIELYAGCGTFTLALARSRTVHAIDNVEAQLGALAKAVREQGPAVGLKPVTTEVRDLARRPLLADELKKADALVLDPPRAGAREVVSALKGAPVSRIIMVSCNPATFARDGALLAQAGYRLEKVTPVDQFLWSPHIELVGCFSKG